MDIPGSEVVKNLPAKKKKRICLLMQETQRHGLNPWVRKIPWSRKWEPAPVFLPGKFHGQVSLATGHGVTKSQTLSVRAHVRARARVHTHTHTLKDPKSLHVPSVQTKGGFCVSVVR